VAERPLFFDIYRLNIVDEGMLPFMGAVVREDADVLRILSAASDSRFDRIVETPRATFKWSVREFVLYEVETSVAPRSVAGLTLARSIMTQQGQTVTDSSIEQARSELSPPSAETIHILFYIARHLVAVEYNSALMRTQLWRSTLLLDASARSLEFQSVLRLEPVPRQAEILTAFRSFDRLTRLRVKLRIPNPELDRRTERLRKELVAGAIREYTQDMRNPRGLSKSEDNLPFATAAMAQAGYKDGEVILNGYRGKKLAVVRTGKRPARLRMERLKDFVRGMAATAKTQETRNAVASILEEVDRLAELPTPPEREV